MGRAKNCSESTEIGRKLAATALFYLILYQFPICGGMRMWNFALSVIAVNCFLTDKNSQLGFM